MRKQIMWLVTLTVCLVLGGCGTKSEVDADFSKTFKNTYQILSLAGESTYTGCTNVASQYYALTDVQDMTMQLAEVRKSDQNFKITDYDTTKALKYAAENLEALKEHDKKYDEVYKDLQNCYEEYKKLGDLYLTPSENTADAYIKQCDKCYIDFKNDLVLVASKYPEKFSNEEGATSLEAVLTEDQKSDYKRGQ